MSYRAIINSRSVMLVCLAACSFAVNAIADTVQVVTTDGKTIEGESKQTSIVIQIDGKRKRIPYSNLLSVHTATTASASEAATIKTGIAILMSADHGAKASASAELTQIGLPVLSPLLASYKDIDLHQPNPHYSLFARLLPAGADAKDRSLDLIRLVNGEYLRGHLADQSIEIRGTTGDLTFPVRSVRRIAVRRQSVERNVEIQSLINCTQIEYLDLGVALTSASEVNSTASGWVRLSFDIDGWSADPDGIRVPGPNYKSILFEEFPFGQLIGRVTTSGTRFKIGTKMDRSDLSSGRLYVAVNDNPHWQNNIGSFRLKLKATNAYDLGDAR